MATPPLGLSLPPGVGCFNTINLHTHGWHVSPSGNSDNVLLNIAPQTSFHTRYNLPADHPAGTFWYHAHRHGSTAVQVASGETGVLIVREPSLHAAHAQQSASDRRYRYDSSHADGVPFRRRSCCSSRLLMRVSTTTPSQAGGPWQDIYTTNRASTRQQEHPRDTRMSVYVPGCPAPDNPVTPGMVENFASSSFRPPSGIPTAASPAVNGIVQPTVTLPAGEIQRWRFVHAGVHDTINLQIVQGDAGRGKESDRQLGTDRESPASESPPRGLHRQHPDADSPIRNRDRRADSRKDARDQRPERQRIRRLEFYAARLSQRRSCGISRQRAITACSIRPRRSRKSAATVGPGGQGPNNPQLLAYVHVRGGKPVQATCRHTSSKACTTPIRSFPFRFATACLKPI